MNLSKCAGDWALVTGASSGIGAEFCRQLASRGFNVVMAARREDLLRALSAELAARHAIRTVVIPIDLALPGSADAMWTKTSGAGIKVRLLINNAAFGPWGSFEKTSAADCERIVQLVASTPIALCSLYRADLTSFEDAGVINLSSPAALQPVPYKAVYSAAKACLHSFSIALYGEWQGTGVMVQTLLPGPTATELDTKGGAYKSAIAKVRRPAADIVGLALSRLADNTPFVTNNKGTFKQKAFAGLAPTKLVVREVKKMFMPPVGR